MVVQQFKDQVTAKLSLRDMVMIGGVVLAGAGAFWQLRADIHGLIARMEPLEVEVTHLEVRVTDDQRRIQRIEDTRYTREQASVDRQEVLTRLRAMETSVTRQTVILEQIQAQLERGGGG